MQPLSPAESAKALLNLADGWDLHANHLRRHFTFKDFKAAIKFVDQVAKVAEKHQHHPDMEINYNRVTLTLFTHDAKGLTVKDFEVAKAIDQL